jgi:hypothetical protein
MRSCVDFPDQSDPSTMMSVPGRSSVEKNISLLALGRGVFWVFFLEIGINKGYYHINICINRVPVKRSHIFYLAISLKSVPDTFLYTINSLYMIKITFSIKDFYGCWKDRYIPLTASTEVLYGKCYFKHI